MIRMSLVAGIALAAAAPGVAATDTPRPGKLKLFRDWIVACDNAKGCEAASLAPEEAMLQDVGLIVARDGAGGVTVRVRDMTGTAKAASVRVDGRTIASTPLDRDGEGEWQGRSATALVAAIARGKRAALLTPRAHGVALNGAAAAFRYMDDRQGRAGTTSALIARGGARYRGTPLALPVVRLVTPPPGPAPAIPTTAINEARRRYGCVIDDGSPFSADAHRLDRRSALVLMSCGAGAYNYLVKPLIWRDGRLRPAAFDYAYHFGDTPGPDEPETLVNVEWSRDGRLSSWGKGRGLGDCGDAQQFGWDGTRFRLLHAAQMTECRGAIDTLTVWRTRAVSTPATAR
ncbi:DUF1176 domain-containing protein [Sphingomonas fuzhouensis]|uniref:DUF1176 domain-containing protein n=1 Tax=Sphingomonas fuzhouensis TaxID=3106033 RepID=UPI002AFFE425|nr:DUF1176 domain-containing protein [Sphingomonas sp. SGZ-02]